MRKMRKMKEIALGKRSTVHTGMVAQVDDEDYDRLMKYSWYVTPRNGKNVYTVIRAVSIGTKTYGNYKLKIIAMNSQLMRAPQDSFIVHHNGNSLDCTKENLMVLTRREYLAMQPPRLGCKSKYKGVGGAKDVKKWKASIAKEFEVQHLGTFKVEKDAALAYDVAAFMQYGRLAYLNFPEEG